MKHLLIVSLLLSLVFSCKEAGKSGKDSKSVNKAADIAPINPAELTELNKSCTSIDVISLRKEVNASMSFTNPEAIQYVISFISDEKALLTVCQPDAHLVFQKNGDITHEADIYFSGECNAVVWVQGGKILNANKFSPEGVDFFKNFLRPRNASIPADTVVPAGQQ